MTRIETFENPGPNPKMKFDFPGFKLKPETAIFWFTLIGPMFACHHTCAVLCFVQNWNCGHAKKFESCFEIG